MEFEDVKYAILHAEIPPFEEWWKNRGFGEEEYVLEIAKAVYYQTMYFVKSKVIDSVEKLEQ